MDGSVFEYVWRPQHGPQHALVKCPIFEVFYGGARGGGKTDAMIGGDWPHHARKYGHHAKGIFFRRELPQLEAAIARSKELYYRLGAEWHEQKKTWTFPDGASLKFRPLERDSDAEKYQGHDYTRVYFEELTNYPDPKPVMKIKATLRSGAGVPVGFRATGNPGGPGHQWVKSRYIDPAPDGMRVITDEYGLERVFIPAKVSDNQILVDNDPQYITRLKQSGSESLVRAWLEGDWDVVEGAFFDNWRHDLHVLRPFEIPEEWSRIRSGDWGSARPFSVGWWAIVPDFTQVNGVWLPRGAMVRYREWYGCKDGEPNVGLKLTAEDVAQGVADREAGETIKDAVLDPAAFANDGGPSIAERMFTHAKVTWRRADNKRVARAGALGGWDQMRARLNGEDFGEPYGQRPMIYTFTTCVDSIRTIPALQHDDTNAEDVDTDGEDHAGDEWRYACMSRPYQPKQKVKEPAVYTLQQPIQKLLKPSNSTKPKYGNR